MSSLVSAMASSGKEKRGAKFVNSHLTFGLNTRASPAAWRLNSKKKRKRSSASVLAGESDEESLSGDERDTNRDIAAQQRALRERAASGVVSAKSGATTEEASSGIYDYDAMYESFSSHAAQAIDQERRAAERKNKKSRYVGNLISSSRKREMVMEGIRERKIARQQKEEEENEEYAGKEKFITRAYREKLAERKKWEKEEEKRSKEEELNDVANRGASAMDGFYGGKMMRRAAMGVEASKDSVPVATNRVSSVDEEVNRKSTNERMTEKPVPGESSSDLDLVSSCLNEVAGAVEAKDRRPGETKKRETEKKLVDRESMLAAARERYLQRLGRRGHNSKSS